VPFGLEREAVAALGTIYLAWGSTYLAIRVMVETIPPLLGAGVRFLAAGALLAAGIAVTRGVGSLRVGRRRLGAAALTGALILVGGIGLLTVAEQHVESGLAALVIASVPLWVVILRRASGDRVARSTVAGVAVGMTGVGVVVGAGLSADVQAWALLVLVAAAISTATGLVASSRLPLPEDAFVATAFEMLSAGVALSVLAALFGQLGRVDAAEISVASIAALLYLIVFGSIVAYAAFVYALQRMPPSLVATYAFVNPVIALLLGWLVLGESLTAGLAAGAVLVVLAVAAVAREPVATTAGERR
jgi:drug/metabolite transporter (DMT)-like permease